VRWDPSREDSAFFEQSAYLYSAYYQLQILIHRPFIDSGQGAGGEGMSTGFAPSLAICTHAARACVKVLHTHVTRVGRTAFSQVVSSINTYRCSMLTACRCRQSSTASSGAVLLLGIWRRRRMGVILDPKMDMADVNNCLAILKASKAQYVPSFALLR
jgi:hypothetical protein